MTDTKPKEPTIAEKLSAPIAEDLAAQATEYGTYVAVSPIDVDGVRAYNTGDPVPLSNVKAHGYHNLGLVEKV